jgi:DNA-binding Lrp family transcriptional regulator
MSETKGRTNTEKRILRALYELQKLDDSESGKLGTYETLMEETLASRSALLSTCQRLTREGVIIRRKINSADRKRWDHCWPVGFARRQAHYSLSLETFREIETSKDDFEERFNEWFDRQIAEDRAGCGLQIPNGGYRIHDDDPGPSRTARRKSR